MTRLKEEGFTLIELLVVIGIIGILAAIVLVAVNPGRQFAQARDTQRQSDLIQVTNAVYQFGAERGGDLPGTDDDPATQEIPDCGAGAQDIGTSAINLAAAGFEDGGVAAGGTAGVDDQIVPTFIAALPVDPSVGDQATTGYELCINNSRLQASAPNAELKTITVTR